MTSALRIYAAYGSNLDAAQMGRRCPSARLIAPVELTGYRLAFAGYSRRWDGGVATLVRDSRRSVPGLLYELEEDDERRLDGFEGCPGAYTKHTVRVQGLGPGRRSAFFYLQPARKTTRPALEYWLVIARAYREHGFDIRPLARAANGAKG